MSLKRVLKNQDFSVPEEEYKENEEKYTTQIESGEDFLITKKNGNKYIATDVTKFDAPCDI